MHSIINWTSIDDLMTGLMLIFAFLGAMSVGVWIGRWLGYKQGRASVVLPRPVPVAFGKIPPPPSPTFQCSRCRRQAEIAQLERMMTL